MRHRIRVLLAAVLLLTCLSGISAGAGETIYRYADEDGTLYTELVNPTVTLTWTVENNTINVEQTCTWDPNTHKYIVTSITDITMCSPKIGISVDNTSTTKYCKTSLTIKTANGFGVPSSLSVLREDVQVVNSEIQCNTSGSSVPDLFIETVPLTVQDKGNGVFETDSWYTAIKRDYHDGVKYVYGEVGNSSLDMVFNLTNNSLMTSLTDLKNWTGTSYNGGSTIKIADFTITLEMVNYDPIKRTEILQPE